MYGYSSKKRLKLFQVDEKYSEHGSEVSQVSQDEEVEDKPQGN